MQQAAGEQLRACATCGLVQLVGEVPRGRRARCPRCRATVRWAVPRRASARAAAFALSALILYPVAMMLPVLEIHSMGRTRSSTIWSGVVELASDGEMFVAAVVFVCSIVVPVLKIGAMFTLCAGDLVVRRPRHRAITYRLLEWIGKWGMVDVLLVAILVALVKLGSTLEVAPGPGTAAFAAVVVLSLLSSAAFDPASIWEDNRT